MSLVTWKASYYPIDAADVPESDALAHSIRKWEGLQKDALKEHGCEVRGGIVCQIGSGDCADDLEVAAHTCALCVHFAKGDEHASNGRSCDTCPLAIARRGVPCDEETADELKGDGDSPYHYFTGSYDAAPMLGWLRRAAEK